MADPQYSEFNDNPEQLLAKIVNNLGVLAGASGQYPNWYDTKDQLIQKIVDNLGVFAATGGGGGGVTSVAGTADQIEASAATGDVVLSLASAVTSMGEIIKKVNGDGVVLADNVAKTIVYLDLPVGTWEVWGNANDFEPLGGDPLLTQITSSISLVDNTGNFSQSYAAIVMTAGALSDVTLLQPWAAFTFAVPTRVYLVSLARFSANAVTAYGWIVARRIPSITVQP